MNNPNDIGMNLEAESFDKAQESMGRQFVKELDALLMAPTKGPEKSQILINGKWAKMQVEALKIAKRAGFGTERGGSKINIDTPKHWPTARPRIRIAAQAAAANEARERATIVGIIGMKVYAVRIAAILGLTLKSNELLECEDDTIVGTQQSPLILSEQPKHVVSDELEGSSSSQEDPSKRARNSLEPLPEEESEIGSDPKRRKAAASANGAGPLDAIHAALSFDHDRSTSSPPCLDTMASAFLAVASTVRPPVAKDRIRIGGLLSQVHVGGAGFEAEYRNVKSSMESSYGRRRTSSKKKSKKGGGGRWTKREDQKLRAAMETFGSHNWKMIAEECFSGTRSDVQCLVRWKSVLQPGHVKGPFSKEEDKIIIDCITMGMTKWSEIAKRTTGRIGKQCRERWFDHLDPSVKKG
ncbi:hypothetical protein TrRE_jg10381, partial [Triparma retinervis]